MDLGFGVAVFHVLLQVALFVGDFDQEFSHGYGYNPVPSASVTLDFASSYRTAPGTGTQVTGSSPDAYGPSSPSTVSTPGGGLN